MMGTLSIPHVLGLNGFGLVVPDLAVAERFYMAFGLQPCAGDNALALSCRGRRNEEIILSEGPRKRLHHVSFHASPGSLGLFADRLRAEGLAPGETPPPGFSRPGLWFRDPWGTWINLDPTPMQAEPVIAVPEYNFGGQIRRVDVNLWQELERDRRPAPLRLGHVLIFTPDWEKAEQFFSGVLGLRATDRIAGKGVFMNAGYGAVDHHCFAMIQSSHRGLQHASFYVGGFDAIGFAAWHMREAGYRDTFGPGRHAIASNLFQYFRDPWGSWVEYYSDMDKITENWVCRDWKSLPYTWGPEWSPEFWGNVMNGNLEVP